MKGSPYIRILTITVFLLIFSIVAKSQSVEYSIKALYIEKIARFSDWNKTLDGECFVIDVLGKSPFHGELENMAKKMKIKNKSVKINYIDNQTEITNCQLLFICSSEKKRLTEILKNIENKNILTISDSDGFCKKGVQINFYIDDSETLKYEINLAALKKANITVDMQLLKYGEIIK